MLNRDFGDGPTRLHVKETFVAVSLAVTATHWIVVLLAEILACAIGTILCIQNAVFVRRTRESVTATGN